MKKISLVTGATGGIGGGFVDRLLARDYEVIAQWRNADKFTALKQQYSDKHILSFESSLLDEAQIKSALLPFKEQNNIPSVIVLAAGDAKSDTAKQFGGDVQASIDYHMNANYFTKERFANVFMDVFPQPEKLITLFPVSSHISLKSMEEANVMKQVGYITSMKKVNELPEILKQTGYFDVHLLLTERVETNLLENFRQELASEGVTIDAGGTRESYAEGVLQNAKL